MSCSANESSESELRGSGPGSLDAKVERRVELDAAPDVVWDELPGLLGDVVELDAEPGGALHVHDTDGERVGVVLEAEPGARLSFRWATVGTDDAPSEVEIALEPSGVGTILHLRETRLDGAHLERSAFRALARV